MRTYHNIKAKGFTLVELSIVLVIIGLIVGGVLTGRDLIKAAQLRAVLSDIEKYNTAVNTFKLKYNALPGDMPNATDIWGANGGMTDPYNGLCAYSGGLGVNTATTATSTCNGSGSGLIGDILSGGGDPDYILARNEPIYFWRHLQNAGLVNCNCSGQSYNDYGMISPSYNSPLSPLGNGSGYSLSYYPNLESSNIYPLSVGHYFSLLILKYNVGDYMEGSDALTATEAYNIDLKIDDGIPSTGTVQSPRLNNYMGYSTNCATSNNISLAKYNLATSGVICSLLFKASF